MSADLRVDESWLMAQTVTGWVEEVEEGRKVKAQTKSPV